MVNENILKLAEKVRDGKATEQEKLQLLQALNFEMGEASKILKEADQKNKKEI